MFSKKTNKAIVTIALVFMLIPTAIVAGGHKESVPSTVIITDGFGRKVIINKPVKRVIAGHFAFAEMMKILKVEDKMVGIQFVTTGMKTLLPKISQLPVVISGGAYESLNYEKIFKLHPDVFVTIKFPSMRAAFDEIAAKLEPEIPVVAFDLQDPEALKDSVRKLGFILDKKKEAEAFISFYEKVTDPIVKKVSTIDEHDKPRVYFEILQYWTINNSCPGLPLPILLGGGINIAADMEQQWAQVDPEWVLTQNPDVIIAAAQPFPYRGTRAVECGYNLDDPADIQSFRNDIMNRTEFAELKAVKNKRVYTIFGEFYSTTRQFVAVAYFAKWLHPGLFADLDPQAIHQEYLTRFMRIDYDLGEHGVFTYPQP